MSSGAAAPASLRAAMERALEALPPADQARSTRLAEAALGALRTVIEGTGLRDGATDLLAADALLTSACDAAVQAGPDVLEDLLARLGLERFEGLLEGAAS